MRQITIPVINRPSMIANSQNQSASDKVCSFIGHLPPTLIVPMKEQHPFPRNQAADFPGKRKCRCRAGVNFRDKATREPLSQQPA